jgi:hypothetical protein
MEVKSLKPNGLHLVRAHLNANGILPYIQGCLDAQPAGGTRIANETDNDFAAQQGLAAPIRGDVAKHAMLNLVPHIPHPFGTS